MDEQLKHLFKYTKFHIGMYTTLIAGIIGVFANTELKSKYTEMVPYIESSILLFFVAGAAGGLVASSIPYHSNFKKFSKTKLGPWKSKCIPALVCTHIEHTAFWLGCAISVIGLFVVLNG